MPVDEFDVDKNSVFYCILSISFSLSVCVHCAWILLAQLTLDFSTVIQLNDFIAVGMHAFVVVVALAKLYESKTYIQEKNKNESHEM